MSARSNSPTGWVGWIYFASLMMMLLGGFEALAGLVGIFNKNFYLVTTDHLLLSFSYKTWGWVDLVLGIVIFLAGVSLLTGSMWARLVAVFLAALSLFANMASIAAYPWWSALMIVVGLLVIYAITVHGGEMKEE